MPYQYLVTLFAVFMIMRAISSYHRHKRTRKELGFWLLFWGGIGVLSLRPDWLSQAARWVGFETGSNALFAFCILVLLYGFGRLMMLVEELEGKVTHLVREQAIQSINRSKQQ